MPDLRTQRRELGLSQAKLARSACISRYRLVSAELGGAPLRPDEQERIAKALQQEAQRLLSISQNFSLEGVTGA